MTLQIRVQAPTFAAVTGSGELNFHAWKGSSWTLLGFCAAIDESGRDDLRAIDQRLGEFSDRSTKVLVVTDASDSVGRDVPVVSDAGGSIARAFGVDRDGGAWPGDGSRSYFIVSPGNSVALTMSYPRQVPVSVDELLRVIDSLQMARHRIATPVDWKQGDDMVVGRVVPDALARARFGSVRPVTDYLRFIPQPLYERRQPTGAARAR